MTGWSSGVDRGRQRGSPRGRRRASAPTPRRRRTGPRRRRRAGVRVVVADRDVDRALADRRRAGSRTGRCGAAGVGREQPVRRSARPRGAASPCPSETTVCRRPRRSVRRRRRTSLGQPDGVAREQHAAVALDLRAAADGERDVGREVVAQAAAVEVREQRRLVLGEPCGQPVAGEDAVELHRAAERRACSACRRRRRRPGCGPATSSRAARRGRGCFSRSSTASGHAGRARRACGPRRGTGRDLPSGGRDAERPAARAAPAADRQRTRRRGAASSSTARRASRPPTSVGSPARTGSTGGCTPR